MGSAFTGHPREIQLVGFGWSNKERLALAQESW